MIGDLALTLDWCPTHVTQARRNHWSAYAEQAVWNVWHPDQAQWGGHPHPWSGWSIEDPASYYHYSVLRTNLHRAF